MNNRISRIFENDNLRIYQRCGAIQNFAPLSRYFAYDIQKDQDIQSFKSRSQVVSYLKKLNLL